MPTSFYSELFDVGSDTALSAFSNPSYVNNADRADWTAIASTESAVIASTQMRYAGPVIAPPVGHVIGTAVFRAGVNSLDHRGGVLVRWNGAAAADVEMVGYRLMARASTWDWVISRHVGGTATWLATGSLPGSPTETSLITLALEVETISDGAGVRLTAFATTTGGTPSQVGTLDDTSSDRILPTGLIGMYLQRPESRITSLGGDYIQVTEDVFYHDPFDNQATNQTLANRTDPYSYVGNTAALGVVAAEDKLGIIGTVAFNAAGPVVSPAEDGYIVEALGVQFAPIGSNNRLAITSRYNGGNWGTATMGAYWLEINLDADALYIVRKVPGSISDFRVNNTTFVGAQGINESSVLGMRLKTEYRAGTSDHLINAWVKVGAGDWIHVVQDLVDSNTSLSSLGTPGFWLRVADQRMDVVRGYYEGAAPPAVLTITTVNPSILRHGNTITVIGTFPETVTNVGVDGETQTINTQDGSSVEFGFVQGALPFGPAVLTLGDGIDTDTQSVTVAPVAGKAFVVAGNLPWPSGQESIYENATPAVKAGDQIEYDTLTDLGANFELNPDGTFIVYADEGVHKVNFRVHDGTEWGPLAEFTFTATLSNPPVAAAGPTRNVFVAIPFVLDGSNSSDDVGITQVLWTQLSGPATATIFDPESLITDVILHEKGQYIFQLQVWDEDNQVNTDSCIVNGHEIEVDIAITNMLGIMEMQVNNLPAGRAVFIDITNPVGTVSMEATIQEVGGVLSAALDIVNHAGSFNGIVYTAKTRWVRIFHEGSFWSR